jgi:flagellar basal body-associated protein FliL
MEPWATVPALRFNRGTVVVVVVVVVIVVVVVVVVVVVMVAVVVGVSTNQLDASNSGTGHQSANL